MTRPYDSTSLVEEWLSDGPDVAPDRVLAEVAGKLGSTRQEGTFFMNGFGRVGVFATAAAVAVGALLVGYLLSRDNVGPPPSPSPTNSPVFGDADVLGYIYGSELWVAAEDGNGARPIVDDNVDQGGVAWSPDGQRLAFFSDGALQIIEASGLVQQVTDAADEFSGPPSWSPDGTQIVGSGIGPGGGDGLVIVDVDSGIVQAMPKAIECMGSPDWGPSGLIVFTGATACSQGGEPTALYTINPDGSDLTELFAFGSELGSAAWSPDGASIAFQADHDGGCLYVIDADGTNDRRLTGGCSQGFTMTWSADSSRIAWGGGAHGSAEANVIDAAGGEPQAIEAIGSITYLDWSPAH